MLREEIDVLREAARRRGADDTLLPVIDQSEALDRSRRALIASVEVKKAERNAASQEVARRKRAQENADDLIAAGRGLGDAIAAEEAKLAVIEADLHRVMLEIPNVPLADVPSGGEAQNVIVKTWGTPRDSAGVKPHWDVMAALGMLDQERAAKISGSGFAVYRGRGARLVRALLSLFMDTHANEHGYEEVWPPQLVTRATMTGTGQLPKFEDDAYATRGDELFLIPTAEVPVTNLYRDEILDAAQLPMAFVAYSRCFRREAGSAGKDTRGVLRTHEFDKVELVRYVAPEESGVQLELLTRHAETMLERLELPYRRKLLAAGDTGFSSAKT